MENGIHISRCGLQHPVLLAQSGKAKKKEKQSPE